jgi:UDP-N-acetylglucosamine acyltransferase
MSVNIHPSSVVSPAAELADGVIVGPFCVVEGDARIGRGTRLRSHVVVGPLTEIGEENDIFPFASVGLECQDLKYKGEPSRLVVGHRNQIRENVTLHRGTEGGGMLTSLGSDNLLQVGSHVAHDCHVGDGCILGQNATLAGHVDVGDGSSIGAFSAVHQFCRTGNHAWIAPYTVVTLDALPFMQTVGTRGVKSFGVNTVGLRRKGFTEEAIERLASVHRILFHRDLPLAEALVQAEQEFGAFPEVAYLLTFIRESKRGIHRG